jgi:hypothetical protein
MPKNLTYSKVTHHIATVHANSLWLPGNVYAGVIAVHTEIYSLNKFLTEMRPWSSDTSGEGSAFLTDSAGFLLAASIPGNEKLQDDVTTKLIHASNSRNPQVASHAAHGPNQL